MPINKSGEETGDGFLSTVICDNVNYAAISRRLIGTHGGGGKSLWLHEFLA
jgi:hypothetical protein